MTAEELIQAANLPLAKIAKAVGEKAEKGQRKNISQEFVDECLAEGMVSISPERHTLS